MIVLIDDYHVYVFYFHILSRNKKKKMFLIFKNNLIIFLSNTFKSFKYLNVNIAKPSIISSSPKASSSSSSSSLVLIIFSSSFSFSFNFDLSSTTTSSSFCLLIKIGSGSFGEAYEAISENSGKRFAVKLEKNDCENKLKLEDEFKCYKTFRGIEGIPRVFYFGTLYEYNCLVLELQDPSLEDLFNFCKSKFSVQTVCLLAKQMIDIIERVPAHFLMVLMKTIINYI
jgi:hypothetical protein